MSFGWGFIVNELTNLFSSTNGIVMKTNKYIQQYNVQFVVGLLSQALVLSLKKNTYMKLKYRHFFRDEWLWLLSHSKPIINQHFRLSLLFYSYKKQVYFSRNAILDPGKHFMHKHFKNNEIEQQRLLFTDWKWNGLSYIQII